MDGNSRFEGIKLCARGTSSEGALNVTESGFTWKRAQGTATVHVRKGDIDEVLWSWVPGGALLRVRQRSKVTLMFHGFKKTDEGRLKELLPQCLDMELEYQDVSFKGHNWGQLSVHGSSIAFEAEDGKHLFELPLNEVGEIQGSKEDTILEFHVDDATISQREDALCSITFCIPDGNEKFAPEEEEKTSAEVFKESIYDKTDTLAGDGDEIALLENVSSLFPRGRYDLSLYPGFMDMDGQNHQFKIRYTNMDRIYVLPRPVPPGNLVIIHMENAIRRGQTYYEWIACFFDSNSEIAELRLNATEEFISKKNAENRANMELVMGGKKDNVFTRLLRGLSGAKVTKAGSFRASDGESCFLACSYRNDAGTLYPLERAFLYTFKPELIPYEHIESVEFERQQSGMHSVSLRTFDLSVQIRPDAATRTKSFQFRSIQKQEWEPLLNFLEAKSVRVANLDQARQGPGMAGMPLGGIAALDEEDEEDDDFGTGGDAEEEEDSDFAGGVASDDSNSDADSDAELIAEEGITVEAVGGKSSKRGRPSAASAAADNESNASDEGEDELEEVAPKKKKKSKPEKAGKSSDGAGKGKKRAKKDKNAPKRGLSAYMMYSNEKRNEVKEKYPDLGFTEIPKKIAEMWKGLSADEKQPYEDMAAKDKKRYEREMEAYNANKAQAEDD